MQSIHIGEKIKQRAKELRIGPTELAREINTSKQNVYGIFKRESIDTDLLLKLSRALQLDFFTYYYDPKLSTTGDGSARYQIKGVRNDQTEELAALRKELSELREKFEFLKKLYELTTEKKAPQIKRTSRKK